MSVNPLLRVMELLDGADVGGANVVEQVENLLKDYRRLLRGQEEAAKRGNYDRLLLSLGEDRNDLLALLQDACMDEGKLDEAKGWGWLASHRKWPYRHRRDLWRWQDDASRSILEPVLEHQLPAGLRLAVHAQRSWHNSAREALQAVVNVIASGAWSDGRAEPPKPDPKKQAEPREVSL